MDNPIPYPCPIDPRNTPRGARASIQRPDEPNDWGLVVGVTDAGVHITHMSTVPDVILPFAEIFFAEQLDDISGTSVLFIL